MNSSSGYNDRSSNTSSPYGGPGENQGFGGPNSSTPNQSGSPPSYGTLRGGSVNQGYRQDGYGGPAGQQQLPESGTDPIGEVTKNYTFTPEEQKVLKECASEAFWFRSLPLAVMLGSSTHMAVQNGYLRAHPKYGSAIKVTAAIATGYFLGKLSYWNACQQKFARLPGSKVGEAIRKRQSGVAGSSQPQTFPSWEQPVDLREQQPKGPTGGPYRQPRQPSLYEAPARSGGTSEASSGFNTDDYVSSLDIDSEKNRYFDDASNDDNRPSVLEVDMERKTGGGFLDDLKDAGPSRGTDYDDLRRQHRDAYLRPPQSRRRPDDQ